MPLLILFLFWYYGIGRNNPRIYKSISDKIPKIIIFLVAISVLSSALPKLLAVSFAAALIMAFTVGPFAFIIWLIKKLFGKNSPKDRKEDYTYYQNNYGKPQGKKGRATTVTGLTRSVPKRRKIVARFNKKYNLTLTEQEIDRIVDASYMSNCWEREIYDMDRDYDSIYQWYGGESGYLRAYLRAFAVQSVSSDFEMQRQICLDSFDQIFRDINPGRYQTVDECVKAINERYLTYFDESIFMIAYRFLEANGKNYELPHSDILKNESDIDRLKHKYDKESLEI